MRQTSGWLLACLLIVLAGCGRYLDRPTAPSLRESVPNLTGSVVGAAAAAILPNGEFELPSQYTGGLSATEAAKLALAYGHMAGRFLEPSWAWDRNGEPIDVSALKLCGRVYLAENAFAELPASAGPALQQRVEAQWLVLLCGSAGDPEVSIAVPVRDTNLYVRSDSVITNVATAYFLSTGVRGVAFPPTPEDAAQAVAAATGMRVSEVPTLVLPPPPYLPQLAQWRLTLEAPATVVRRDTHSATSTFEIYFGYGHVVAASTYGLWLALDDATTMPRLPLAFHRNGVTIPLLLRTNYADQFARVDGEDK